ncbi:MAG TPA: CvpA family protein [Flavisolibacter sp.]|nr:CvpA family protein [Flavisolibacter sp.]
MNWVDGVLIGIVILAMWAGWQKGFILGVVDLLVWIGSVMAGFFAYKYFGDFFQTAIPSLGVWTLPLAFIVTIILARIILSFIFYRFVKATPREAHHHGVNHALGLVPGFVNGLLYSTIAAALLFAIPLSQHVSDETKKSQFAGKLATGVEWLDSQLSPIFKDATRQTLNNLTVEPKTDETVELSFTVSNAKPRPDLESKMLQMVNAERTKRGLQPLKPDAEMTAVARKHSQDMFSRGYFSHYTPEGKDPFDRMKASNVSFTSAGENLALGQTLTICHQGLMNSPGHKANILRPTYGRLGIGILDGGIHGLMISQEFRN